MPRIHLIAVGRLKSGPMKDVFDDYAKRLKWDLRVHELDIRDDGAAGTAREHQAILGALIPDCPLIVLDERGKTMASPAFAKIFQDYFDHGAREVQIVIGGADGLNDDIRARAKQIISFGAMTWPHMMVRMMLAEQLYRAETIIAGHPYHRA